MTSRERVLTAFAHKEPDKVPVDFGGMCTSMVNCQVVAQLRDYYGLAYDESRYMVYYDAFGDNVVPEIYVTEVEADA